jgi:hypothetical protein
VQRVRAAAAVLGPRKLAAGGQQLQRGRLVALVDEQHQLLAALLLLHQRLQLRAQARLRRR